MVEFLQHIRDGNFTLTWSRYVNPKPLPGYDGCCGEYGPGYGSDDKKRDIQIKYGIHKPGFVPPSAIRLEFCINNRKGFDYLCEFAQKMGYEVPIMRTTKVKLDVRSALELKEAQAQNDAKNARVQALIRELEELTNISLDDCDTPDIRINDWINTDQFYNWRVDEEYPILYSFVEEDNDRIKSIWFESNIMRDCWRFS